MCCFEPLALPDSGERVLAIRVLGVIDFLRINPGIKTREKPPRIKENSLLPYIDPVTGSAKPWFLPRPDLPEEPAFQYLMSLPELI